MDDLLIKSILSYGKESIPLAVLLIAILKGWLVPKIYVDAKDKRNAELEDENKMLFELVVKGIAVQQEKIIEILVKGGERERERER